MTIKILIVKMSSMGDVLHALPVLNDIKKYIGEEVEIDWLTEPHYQFILKDHPHIHQLHTFPLRSFKKNIFKALRSNEAKALKTFFKNNPYDYILDLQGLSKSAWLARWAKGKRIGYDKHSIREPLASRFYHHTYTISKDLHAITRMRQLTANALNYAIPLDKPNYGLVNNKKSNQTNKPNLILFPFTTWQTKHYPIEHWYAVIGLLADHYHIHIAWGSAAEKQQAEHLALGNSSQLTPDLSIAAMKNFLENMDGFIGVDTGFSHLATAMDIPGVVLMGPTDKHKSGPLGDKQIALDVDLPCRPCHKRICKLPIISGELRPACLANIHPDLVAATFQNIL